MTNDEVWYARPVFSVVDCERAWRFYTALGFQESWRYEEEGVLIALQMNRAGVEIILNRNASRAGGGRLFLSLNRGEVAQVVTEFAAAGLIMGEGEWGMPVKFVTDPDGNDLLFYDDNMRQE